MATIPSNTVSSTMREWLLVNRMGKLHSAQWRELVTEPLVPLLLLMVPGIMLLRSFLLTLFVGGLWMVGLGLLLGLGIMLFLRARRYARLPIYVATLRAAKPAPPVWMFWKTWEFADETGNRLDFYKSLSPDNQTVEVGKTYLVYYLREADRNILLSLAAVDHPDSSRWQPTSQFNDRLKRRAISQD